MIYVAYTLQIILYYYTFNIIMCLMQICGVVSEHTQKMCTRSVFSCCFSCWHSYTFSHLVTLYSEASRVFIYKPAQSGLSATCLWNTPIIFGRDPAIGDLLIPDFTVASAPGLKCNFIVAESVKVYGLYFHISFARGEFYV